MPKIREVLDKKGCPVWRCSHCNKRYRTLGLAKQHERQIHNKGGN